jgi:spore coat protein U-like protein
MGENFMSKFSLSLLLTLSSLLFIGEAQAATCNFTITTNVAFGNYDVLSTSPNNSGQGTVRVTCNYSIARNVTLWIGASPNSGGFNPRKMKLTTGTDLLNYNLFTDSARTMIFGDYTHYNTVQKSCPNYTVVEFPIYGQIPAGADVSVGTYNEVLVVTINY